MDNRQEKFELLAGKLAECHNIPKDEVLYVLNSITIVTQSIIDALGPLAKEIAKSWGDIKELIRPILNRKDKITYDNKMNWIINWDTRKESLVISNRPRFMVRKIC